MTSLLEEYSTWETEALIKVPPETLEYVDLVGLVLELQDRLSDLDWRMKGLEK